METQKAATKRLLSDMKELEENPIEGVSASPLQDNIFEWHCNLSWTVKDTKEVAIFHVILFFPDNYPAVSPSAEFLPPAFTPIGGATKKGKKGTQICLSIFSDFAKIHKEWANEKGTGWSPSYTTQTVLLNLVSFLNEMTSHYNNSAMNNNVAVSKSFVCKDCSHSAEKPYPPLPTQTALEAYKQKLINEEKKISSSQSYAIEALTCYVTKLPFQEGEKGNSIFGFGISKTGNQRNPNFTSPCEVMTLDGFEMLKKNGKVESVLREEIDFFLPLFLTPTHGSRIRSSFEASCCSILATNSFTPNMVLQVLPKLLNSTVVTFMNGTSHTSEKALQGYFMFHRLFLWCLEQYPNLLEIINNTVKNFVTDPKERLKSVTPNVGEWLTLLTVCNNCDWEKASIAYLTENFDRNVMWYLKENPSLGNTSDSISADTRLKETFRLTKVSRDLCVFQVLFLDIARPSSLTIPQIIERYDKNNGLPTLEMEQSLKQVLKTIQSISNYEEWFKAIKVPYPGQEKFNSILKTSVDSASNKEGYFMKSGGRGKRH